MLEGKEDEGQDMRQYLSRMKDIQDMRQRQSLPGEQKLILTQRRIREWYEYWEGQVYVSFSGGKDSTALLDIVWNIYPDVPAVFSNTGLEYPEIVDFVKQTAEKHPGRVVIVRPKKTFLQVIQEHGYPVVSKKVSYQLRILREHKDNPRRKGTYCLYDTGVRGDGELSLRDRLPDKWRKLVNADFRISEKCCDELKKKPFRVYGKDTGRKPITGMTAGEGGVRSRVRRCNAFTSSHPISSPMLFWLEKDVWEYLREREVPYCQIYDYRYGALPPKDRTGCMFCAFGAHLEGEPNRFQQMAVSHPKQYAYCMDKLGMRHVLDVVGVPVTPPLPMFTRCEKNNDPPRETVK